MSHVPSNNPSALIERLRKRADWLRSEYLNGGDIEHLKAREDECRYIITLLELMPQSSEPLLNPETLMSGRMNQEDGDEG